MKRAQMETAIQTLLPCPFCGERLVVKDDHHGSWIAHRLEPGPCIDSVTQLHDATAIKEWNTRAPPADERVKGLVEALDAQAEAERLDCEHQELVDQSEAEGWDERTGESHLTSSWKRVGLAYAHARQLRAAALASYRASDRQGGE